MIDDVFSGLTVTIFAYGVTSSGKTHTMQGTKTEPGIIPRAVESLFRKIQYRPNISISVSYMEIYKDEVYDLLVDRENAPKLPVRENGSGQVFVAHLSEQPISNVEEFEWMYTEATRRRSVASTNLNRASSRSHAILTLLVRVEDEVLGKALTGKLNLVDLAGSENNKLTGNDPSRMAESSAINKSLSVLGQVVHALNQGASRVPYRNSKLTRILQDALGGSSIGLLICNIAPPPKYRQDTLNTLNFATRTKNIENKPVVNEKDLKPAPKPSMSRHASQPPQQRPPPTRQPSEPPAPLPTAVPTRSRIGRPSLAPRSSLARPEPVTVNVNIPPQQQIQQPVLSEEEINKRIAKAVEAEVAKRLAEHEMQMKAEREKVAAERRSSLVEEGSSGRFESSSGRADTSGTSGKLEDPGMGHTSVDEELRQRLSELEQRFESGSSEMRMLSDLSPGSRKRTGRAYVALARAQSEKNNLQLALELYRKAEAYVPDNIKLKERIIEIEWAVKNNKAFKPSPKKPKRKKAKKAPRDENSKKSHSTSTEAPAVVLQDSRDENSNGKRERAEQPFGSSLLFGSMASGHVAAGEEESMCGGSHKRQAEGWETPKRSKKMRSSSIADGVGSEDE
ncbi:hypothetical protein QCA50_016730 [Cerrena zonata]|uniref:Kinesin-like protein n=1 Tax=Cerrena zonata TaxID=2478898 RepID=A0AAW0FS84_9APHY